MRKVKNNQMFLGQVDISKINIDEKSRDDIPQVLLGLKHIYQDDQVRKEIFQILEENILSSKCLKNGRPGMDLWNIFVLGTLRLTINCDYDRLVELANNHSTLRQMLGHCIFNDSKYILQTVKDNVKLLTLEVLYKINTSVIRSGHKLCKKKTIPYSLNAIYLFLKQTFITQLI